MKIKKQYENVFNLVNLIIRFKGVYQSRCTALPYA